MHHLYFVAILPSAEVQQKITEVKEIVSERYQSKHALKTPPHITMFLPFKFNKKEESLLAIKIEEILYHKNRFNISLSNFSCFPPRVIFIKVEDTPELQSLKRDFNKKFEELELIDLSFKQKGFHPHITIAHRDLSPQNFKKAWSHFEKESFTAEFKFMGLTLLRHNGKHWEILFTQSN